MEEPGVGLSGGMNVFLRSLLPGLAAHGFRTDVLTRGKGTGVEITRPFPGVRIFHLPCGWRVPVSRESAWDALPRFVRKARKLLAADRAAYDVVSAHYWMSAVAYLHAADIYTGDIPGFNKFHVEECPRPWMRPSPLVFSYHTIEARKAGSAGTPPRALPAIRWEAEKRLAREVSCVVCFSEDDLAGTREIFPAVAGKGTVIPPGVDDAFRNPPPRAGARQQRGIPAGAFLFLIAAREDPGKNVVSAIETFRALRAEEGNRLRLLVAGQKLPAALLPEGAACAGPVPHAEMPALFSAADAVLCPSSYESFGLVPLEAMAAGKPVIVPRAGFWGATIRSEGGGVTYAPEAKTGLAGAMRAVCLEQTLRTRLAEEGKRIAARFTWERCTSLWARLLSSAARPGSPR